MKFGVRECANIVFRAKQNVKIGNQTFHVGQPVLYIDTATTSSMEQASTTTYAQGGRGNVRLLAWEGDKTLTFTFEDALLSPIGFHILSGAGLFREAGTNASGTDVHFHMTSMASVKKYTPTSGTAKYLIDLSEAIKEFGTSAKLCSDDAPLFVLETDTDGSLTGGVVTGASILSTNITGTDSVVLYDTKYTIELTAPNGATDTDMLKNVMVDYYIDLPGEQVWEADITPDTFAGYYYIEADTLFRRQFDGKDLPANLTFPNAKIQSNFTITMAGTGDPSSFTFTIDAFPGYTYFDQTKKVLCVLQIAGDVSAAQAAETSYGEPVMPHNNTIEHPEDAPVNSDSVADNGSGE